MARKEPPHSREIEAAFLADLFTDPQLMKTYLDRIQPNDLYVQTHRKIYRAMRQAWVKGGDLDTLLVCDVLKERGHLGAVGDASTVERIANKTPSAVKHKQHADRVVELAKRRRLIANFNERIRSLESGDELENVAKLAASDIRKTLEGIDGEGRPDDPSDKLVTSERVAEWLTGDRPAPRDSLLTDGDGPGATPFMVRGKASMLVAPGGGGKTGLLTQLAVAVASGTEWLGYNVKRPGRVLLALGEEDENEMQRRIYDAYNGATDDSREIAERVAANLVPLPLYGTNPRFMERPEANTVSDETPFYRNMIDYLEERGPWALIIIDPASRFMGAEVETDNAAATRFVELLEKMTQVDGDPTVLAAHHTNKGALSGKTDQGAARGSSALVDGVRWVANVEIVEDPDGLAEEYRDWRRLRVTKTNYTKRTPPMYLRWAKGAGWTKVEQYKVEARESEAGRLEKGEKPDKTKSRKPKKERVV